MRVGKVDKRVLGPVLMGFFIMGFCDMVAPITGRIALEFPASRQAAVSFLPTMVFLWFLVLSTPLAALMNRIGRKATALIGYAFTVVGLMVPYVAGEGCALGWYFAGFGLLGVGLTGFAMACVFATFYAVATKAVPEKANEVAGLMILAISAGAVSGPVCGAIVRWSGDAHWGMLFVALCVGYMLWASFKLKIKQ